jgi:hypothetical protein
MFRANHPFAELSAHVSMIYAHGPILPQNSKVRYRTLEGLEGLEAFLFARFGSQAAGSGATQIRVAESQRPSRAKPSQTRRHAQQGNRASAIESSTRRTPYSRDNHQRTVPRRFFSQQFVGLVSSGDYHLRGQRLPLYTSLRSTLHPSQPAAVMDSAIHKPSRWDRQAESDETPSRQISVVPPL